MTALLLVTGLLLGADPVDDLVKQIEQNAKDPFGQARREHAIRVLGSIGSPESTRALEPLLEDPYLHLQDATVSALIELQRSKERAASLQLMGEWLRRRRNPTVRIHLATALGLIRDLKAVPFLEEALRRERDPAVIAGIALALERLGDPTAIGGLVKKADLAPKGRAACVHAMGMLRGGTAYALRYKDDEDERVRAAVVDVCARRGRPVLPDREVDGTASVHESIAFADALRVTKPAPLARRRAAALLEHPSWRVRAAAIAGVTLLRDPTLLGDLVARMEKETGRLRGDAWRALRTLTRKDIAPDPVLWRAILPLAELPARARKRKSIDAPAGTAAYFGLPVMSERIAFVFDVSGSMREEGKMELARKRFGAMAKELKPQQRYDLFVHRFPSDHPPRPKLLRAFGRLLGGKAARASSWLARQKAKGWGAIYDALAAAIRDPEVDTIYLLSDGRPTRGTVSRDFRIRQEIRRLNRWRRVRINTILLGEKMVDRRFMERLADGNGGVAVDGEGKRLR
ncbi:MAG: HEAT repeat domain-containing protein [Planctomycetota bacterium]|nr:HEAT repeat domain-containing protein [Planctomycetota bacterium]